MAHCMKTVIVLFQFLITGSSLDIGAYDLERGRPAKCEPITIPMCQGIGYNMTRMPNFMNYESQEEANIKLNEFAPLVEYGCDVHLRFFLCSLYVPMCAEQVSATIPACRPMCEQARQRCSPIMEQFSFGWPDSLDCSKLPTNNDPNALCIEAPENDTQPETKKARECCRYLQDPGNLQLGVDVPQLTRGPVITRRSSSMWTRASPARLVALLRWMSTGRGKIRTLRSFGWLCGQRFALFLQHSQF